jgi:ABC-type transport system involved in multi-copper enzyme maturation permease subunit
MNKSERIWIIRTITARELKTSFRGIGFYIVVFIILIASSLTLKNYVQAIESEGFLISANPLCYPLFISVLISSIYLALVSAITISREREEGTLQTLFFSPIDHLSYLLGKFFSQMILFVIIISVLLVYFLLSSFLINFAFASNMIWLLVLFIFIGSCIISFGMFLSTLTTRIKTSVILFMQIPMQNCHQFQMKLTTISISK